MQTLRAILFDFDGVIANTEPLHFAGLRRTVADIGITLTESDYYANYLGFDDRGCFLGSRDAFLLDEKGNLALAGKDWKEEVERSNAFLQRTKRLVFRVPHYKSGKELADQVARAKGVK